MRPRGISWRPDVQGLRALAVVVVIAYHVGLPLGGGFIGVDIFFVISGFVITGLFLRRQDRDGSLRLRTFWGGRVRRILPALSVVVVAVLLSSILLEDPSGAQQQTFKTAIATMLMVSNVFLERSGVNYFMDATYTNPLLNMWSLAVEEQFYVIFPLLLLLALALTRWRPRRHWLALLLAGVAVASFAWGVVTSYSMLVVPGVASLEAFAFFSVTTRAWEFAVGAGLAFWARKGSQLTPRSREWAGWIGFILIAVALVTLSPEVPFPGVAALLPVGGTALVIAAGTSGQWTGSRLLSTPPAIYLGDRSYSLYLWHWPMIVFAEWVFGFSWLVMTGAVALALLLTMATYNWVEQPFRDGIAAPMQRTIGAASLAVFTLALAVAAGQGVRFGWGQSWTLGAHEAMRRDCDVPPLDPRRCHWGPDPSSGTVLVVGDSQAWAVGDAVIDAAESLGMSTVISAHNNCPFTAGELPQEGECAAWQQEVLDYISSTNPNAVVIANAAYGGTMTAELVDQVMADVQGRGSVPLWLLNPPAAGDDVRTSLLIAPPPDRTSPRPEPQFQPGDLAELRDQWGAWSVISPEDALCMDDRCLVAVSGMEYYTDGNHLSVDGAALLEPQIRRSLEYAMGSREP